jgi:prephenate dehydrogenase
MGEDVPGFFIDRNIVIFGLGLMGGSLAMALKGKCRSVTGIDPDPVAVNFALDHGIVEKAALDPGDLVQGADIIILAAPVKTIIALLGKLPKLCDNHAVVIDFGSTKTAICEEMQKLPPRFDPIGGHPMCGKETSGLSNAEETLFKNAVFALVPMERTKSIARQTAESLVRLLDSIPVWLSPAEHDRQVAITSHLPYLAANALAFCTPLEAASMAASGFSSTSRLAVTPPEMMMDVLQTNRDAILPALHQYLSHLERLEGLLEANNFSAMAAILEEGSVNRTKILQSRTGKEL